MEIGMCKDNFRIIWHIVPKGIWNFRDIPTRPMLLKAHLDYQRHPIMKFSNREERARGGTVFVGENDIAKWFTVDMTFLL